MLSLLFTPDSIPRLGVGVPDRALAGAGGFALALGPLVDYAESLTAPGG
jgi:hypothetical protein